MRLRDFLEDEIPLVSGDIDFRRIQRLSSSEIISEGQNLYSRWGDLACEEKRSKIERITERITFTRTQIRSSSSTSRPGARPHTPLRSNNN